MSQPNRRQTLVVDPRQQMRMLTSIALVPSAIVLATAAALAWVYLKADRQLPEAMVEAPDLLAGILGAICFLFAAIALLLLLGLRASHRLFGPAYRIARSFEAVMEGKLQTRIKLRDGDHLVELAEQLNGFLAWLEQHPPQNVAAPLDVSATQPAPAVDAMAALLAEPTTDVAATRE